jgi:hypothetical protein
MRNRPFRTHYTLSGEAPPNRLRTFDYLEIMSTLTAASNLALAYSNDEKYLQALPLESYTIEDDELTH